MAIKSKIDGNSRISLSDDQLFDQSTGNASGLDSTSGNTFVGYLAGQSVDAGSINNTFIGHGVGDASLADATYNVGVGAGALSALTQGDSNVVVGANSGLVLSTGERNVFIGNSSGYATADAENTILIGYNAGSGGDITSGATGSIGIGTSALAALTSGAGNIAIGLDALDAVTTGSQNIAIGYQAADSVLAAYASNIGIGSNSLGGSHTGTASIRNVAVGEDTLAGAMNDSDNNVAIGWTALTALTLGDQNVVIGASAGDSLTSGSGNVAIGAASMGSSTDVDNGVFIGKDAGGADMTSAADGSILIGKDAGAALTSGIGNVAIGSAALDAAATSDYNTAVGGNALSAVNGDGTGANTGVGYNALASCTTGIHNVAMNVDALSGLTTGNDNIAIGFNAGGGFNTGETNKDSDGNVFIGTDVGGGNWADGKTEFNVGIGDKALNGALSSSEHNISIGWTSGQDITSGTNNILIGSGADVSTGAGTNQIVIGYAATGLGNNRAVIGNNAIEHVYMASDGDAVVYCGGINMSNNQPVPDAGTSTSETLDSYEEGTWTAGNGGTTVDSVTNTTGYYTKIGRKVFFFWYSGAITFSSSSGTATITGLPFTSSNASHAYGLFTFEHGTGVDGNTTGGYIETNATNCAFLDRSSTSFASYTDSGGNFYIMVSGHYFVA